MAPPTPSDLNLAVLPLHVQHRIFSHLPYESLVTLCQVSRSLHAGIGPDAAAHASPASRLAFVMRAEKDFPQHWPRHFSSSSATEHPGNFACYVCFRVRGPEYFDDCQGGSVFWDTHTGRVVREDDDEYDGIAGLGQVQPYTHAQAPAHPTQAHHSRVGSGGEAAGSVGAWNGGGGVTGFGFAQQPQQPHSQPVVPFQPPQFLALRRFCIDCGLRHGMHRPGDLIGTKMRQELWVCNCRQVREKVHEMTCRTCQATCILRPRRKHGV